MLELDVVRMAIAAEQSKVGNHTLVVGNTSVCYGHDVEVIELLVERPTAAYT